MIRSPRLVALLAASLMPSAAGFGGDRPNHVLLLEPKAAQAADATHAAMVVSQRSFENVRFSGTARTLAQLRQGSAPNTWETAWVVFNHAGDERFYYVALKVNGWELGKADAAYPGAQRFLATGSDLPTPVGEARRFEVTVEGATIAVWIDGRLVTTFTDEERPYLSGSVGFYTEDARVAFDDVAGSIEDDFESYGPRALTDGDVLGEAWKVAYVGYGRGAIELAEVPWSK